MLRVGEGVVIVPRDSAQQLQGLQCIFPRRSPSDGSRPALPPPPKQEPVAEPDQLAGPLRTGKVGAWDSTIWPLSQKDSWAGDAERGLWVTWLRPGRWGPGKPAAALGVRTKGGHKEDTGIRDQGREEEMEN